MALRRRLDSAIYFNNKYSISPRNIFLREMRLNRLKLFIYKIFGFDVVNDIELNIKVLAEYLKKIDEDS